MRRVYLDTPLAPQQTLALTRTAFHHLVRVLRCRDGESLCVFNGDGRDYRGHLQLEGKKSAVIHLVSAHANACESPLHTTLIQGLSKGERMDIVMQKAVELGVNTIIPVRTAFCAVKLDSARLQKKRQHWQAVMIAACEQSGRASVPILQPVQPLSEALQNTQAEVKWLLHPYPQPHQQSLHVQDNITRAALVVGPEGGLSDEEVTLAMAQGFIPKTLGARILRTETAALAGLALCQQLWGDWHA